MTNRRVCTKETPYDLIEKSRGWSHPEAIEIDEDYGKGGGVSDGDFVKYMCPICGIEFWEELPN